MNTSLSGEVIGCGEIERFGLAFQTTLLLSVNMPTLRFHLTVKLTASKWTRSKAYCSCITSGKGFHLVPYISDMKSPLTRARISYPPSMNWCLNMARGCNSEWCICLWHINNTGHQTPFPKQCNMNYEWILHYIWQMKNSTDLPPQTSSTQTGIHHWLNQDEAWIDCTNKLLPGI
jgi:hypothetical protein